MLTPSLHAAHTLCPRDVHHSDVLVDSRLSAGHELALFYFLGILDAREDDHNGDAFDALISVLIGVFDGAPVYLNELFLNKNGTLHVVSAVFVSATTWPTLHPGMPPHGRLACVLHASCVRLHTRGLIAQHAIDPQTQIPWTTIQRSCTVDPGVQ